MCIYPYTIFEACGHTVLHQRPIQRCKSITTGACQPSIHPYRSYRAYRQCHWCETNRVSNIEQAESKLHAITIPESRWRVRFNDPNFGGVAIVSSKRPRDAWKAWDEAGEVRLTKENYARIKAGKMMERGTRVDKVEGEEEHTENEPSSPSSPASSSSPGRRNTALADFILRSFSKKEPAKVGVGQSSPG